MKQLGFRGRLFFILFAFALVPSALLLFAWGATGRWVLPMVGATAAWDSVGTTGHRAIAAVERTPLDSTARAALREHERLLNESLQDAKRTELLIELAPRIVFVFSVFILALLTFLASRAAGHLSRNLSRPLQELVGWTGSIGRGEGIPVGPPQRGAPEFEVLRERMRAMSAELRLGQARAVEAERGATLRESARQVAHELKNPLTPIRFAVARLKRDAPPGLAETVEVLAIESERLETMARSFAQFGRLPEGPTTEIDLGELARHAVRAGVPEFLTGTVEVERDVPMITGHYDALARALTNIVRNAVDACGPTGEVTVRVALEPNEHPPRVQVAVHDSGCGIPRERIDHIWDPYVTTKAGGTGLGLAIVRQTVVAHGGAVGAESGAQGTTVRFTIPVHAHHTENAHA